MDPARSRVPLLCLDSLHLLPNEPPSPSQLIESYLGIQLNCNYCYLSACINDTVCNIWSRRLKKSEDSSLQNVLQEEIFNKVVRILKDKKPIRMLSELCKEKSKIEIRYEPPIGSSELKNIECRAGLIAAIFYERICMRLNKESHLEQYHRKALATALKWHCSEFFKNESQIHLKTSSSCPDIIEEFGDPTIKFSPGGRMIKKPSQGQMHRSLPWILPQSKLEHDDGKDWSLLAARDLIKELSMECLDYCRTCWVGRSPSFISESGRLEYLKLQSCGFLLKPEMGLLLQEELARDISFSINEDSLCLDLGRNIHHLSVNNACSSSSFPKGNVENLKKGLVNDEDKFVSQSCRFQNLLTNLMLGLGVTCNKRDEILEKWKRQVQKEKLEISNDSFSYALRLFFNSDLSPSDKDENNLRQLLILMRQRMYMHPMVSIREVLNEIPLHYEPDNPSRVMAYHFLSESVVEYHVSFIASVTQETLKSAKKMKALPSFQLELLNIMRASLDDLSSWSSEISIEIKLLSGKKKGILNKELFEQMVTLPLQRLGFKVVII